jgi:hypothetical protein
MSLSVRSNESNQSTDFWTAVGHPCRGIRQSMLDCRVEVGRIGALAGRQQRDGLRENEIVSQKRSNRSIRRGVGGNWNEASFCA